MHLDEVEETVEEVDLNEEPVIRKAQGNKGLLDHHPRQELTGWHKLRFSPSRKVKWLPRLTQGRKPMSSPQKMCNQFREQPFLYGIPMLMVECSEHP